MNTLDVSGVSVERKRLVAMRSDDFRLRLMHNYYSRVSDRSETRHSTIMAIISGASELSRLLTGVHANHGLPTRFRTRTLFFGSATNVLPIKILLGCAVVSSSKRMS